MKRLTRGLVLAALVACSGTEQKSGYLVLAINTGDLMLPKDTGRVGLYLTQIDATGKMIALPPIEREVTLDAAGNPSVHFPGTLVVESSGEDARLRSRLVAFRSTTRDVLTMRETRSVVPVDGGALLRLNLFLTNQGNVTDQAPGQPVTDSSVQTDSTLRVQQQADGNVDPYARFVSMCDGAPAAVGRTSGDDGRCVDLDVQTEPFPAGTPLPGSDENEFCYDVSLTFARRDDDAVPLVELLDLPATGECRIELPRRFDPARLNVAIVSADGLRGEGYVGLRPLAAGIAFKQTEDNALLVPERVCNMLRNTSIVLSQRTSAWGGRDPVCAPWTVGKKAGSFDGPVPGPGADAGPKPAANAYEVASLGAFHHMTARDGVVGLSFEDVAMQGKLPVVTRIEASAFETGVADNRGVEAPSSFSAMHAASAGSTTQIYLTTTTEVWQLPPAGAALAPVTFEGPDAGSSPQMPLIAMLGGAAYSVWWRFDTATAVFVAPLTSATAIAQPVTSAQFVGGNFFLPYRLNTVSPTSLIIPSLLEGAYFTGTITAESVALAPDQQSVSLPSSRLVDATRVGDRMFGFYEASAAPDGGEDPFAFDYANRLTYPAVMPLASEFTSRPIPDGYCAVYRNADAAATHTVTCRTLEQLQKNEAGSNLLERVSHAAIDVDDQYLYLANTCAVDGPVHVQRVLLAELGKAGAVTDVCP